jgi:hypothetical protein
LDIISIFDGLTEELLPTLSSPPEHVLIDPSDVGSSRRARSDGAKALYRRSIEYRR